MKYCFMAEHRGEHRVEKMATNLGVTRSGYYAWLGRGKAARRVDDEQLGDLIKGIQQEVKYRYGSPRMTRLVVTLIRSPRGVVRGSGWECSDTEDSDHSIWPSEPQPS
jgi:hypothetical protein